jgi:hypothetical protein
MNMHLERMMVVPGLLIAAMCVSMFAGCKPEKREVEVEKGEVLDEAAIRESAELPLRQSLAEARLALAMSELDAGLTDHALLHAVSSLEAHAGSVKARAQVAAVLIERAWAMPEHRIHVGRKVDHLLFRDPDSLWVAASDEWNTISRWNSETLTVEAVLFPLKDGAVRGMVLDPSGQWMVVERQGRALLCDARSLEPVCDIGALSTSMTPSSAIAFSSDGLLLAHPALDEADPRKLVWHLRDAKSGEILRSEKVMDEAGRQPLLAQLDRKNCRVTHSDGSHWVMPVVPLEPCFWEDAKESTGPKHASLLPDPDPPRVKGDGMCLESAHVGPIRSEVRISAAQQSDKHMIVANEHGDIDFFRLVGFSSKTHEGATDVRVLDLAALASLKKIALALTGLELDSQSGEMVRHDAAQRIAATRECDFDLLAAVFPEVDFTKFREVLEALEFRRSDELSVAMLDSRLAEADPEAAGDGAEIADLFASGDMPKIVASIEVAGPNGAAAAKHLQFALASTDASLIEACLRHFSDMPPILQRIARSRMAWLQQRKVDAIASWPEPFPDYKSIRLAEDWHGWEQADFSQVFHAMRECVTKEIDSLKLPPEPSAEQLQELAERFEDQETMRAVGRTRYAKACIDAAFVFCKFKDHAQTALTLATRARNLGHPPEPCLRAEAMAYTALGDYHKAHDRWLLLITEFPVATHESGDYAEAAYTAFENSDARQAIEILVTGMHRFPNDADFALRAGWIALLTDHGERAYRFLLAGQQIGYRAEKIENATAMLAVAALQCGAKEDASAYYTNLVESDPAWKDAKAVEALDWPEELKSALESVRASTTLIAPTR